MVVFWSFHRQRILRGFFFLNSSRLPMKKRVFLLLYSLARVWNWSLRSKEYWNWKCFLVLLCCLPHLGAYSEKGNMYLVLSF